MSQFTVKQGVRKNHLSTHHRFKEPQAKNVYIQADQQDMSK
jgi:hypothetical protein